MIRISSFYISFLLLFLLPLQLFSQNQETNLKPDRFGGIGISVDIDSSIQLPYVIEVLSGKPGAMAGLRSADYITAINSWPTKGKPKEQIVNKLRGRAGTKVRIRVKRGDNIQEFEMKRERIVVLPQPSNLCDALDTLLKSAVDSFASIRGRLIKEPLAKGQPPDYEWQSALKLPGFGTTTIIKKYDSSAYFKSLVYISKDSIQAISRYQKLVSDLKDCLPYSVADSYQEHPLSYGIGFSTSYIIRQFKGKKYKTIKSVVLTVIYEHLRGQPSEVHLVYRFEN
jgi:hypothetical protein